MRRKDKEKNVTRSQRKRHSLRRRDNTDSRLFQSSGQSQKIINGIFKVLNEKIKPAIVKIYTHKKISFRNESEIKTFTDPQKWREYVAGRSELKETTKENSSGGRRRIPDGNMIIQEEMKMTRKDF